ncbi:MAG TPA: bifunctional diguanylate cyclase/phosphodiesterase, partial [Solirubrobacteraceae bacterium]|nr:bifunctional diguanylate cyclase/phosphodiesterase [Solirubrobacteraceae bacterium]
AGRPRDATVVTPSPYTETAPEIGLGKLVEVYVPLRFSALSEPSGAFEIYLRYAPIAASIAGDKRTILIVVAIGLALLWALLYRIVAQASRRLTAQAEENYELARYDQLTGLPNRTLFHERVAACTRETAEHPDDVAVLLIDLDGFTEINNTLGDRTGNQLLRNVGERLRAMLGGDAFVARLGADEFAVLCTRTGGIEGALEKASAVHSSLETPLILGGVAVNVDANVGVAVGEAQETPEAFIQRADAALARAKVHHSRVEVHSAERDSFDTSRLILLGQVRHALEREEFTLHYQPKLDLKTGRALTAEALLRWQHPTRGMLMPATFMALIEQTALISATTTWVLTRALRQMVRWGELGLDIGVAVNLSARNLVEDELPAKIAALLREHRIEPDRLTIEVTETATMTDPERAVKLLNALRTVGVRVSIDDFGTGNASITYLTRLPASELKVDRSLVAGICESARAEAIMRSTVDLAHYLDLTAVAEGIERADVLERLTELGCDAGQGYLFAKPMPAGELVAWLERRPVASGAPSPAGVGAAASPARAT